MPGGAAEPRSSGALPRRGAEGPDIGGVVREDARAEAEGRNDMIDTATLMTHYGATLHIVEGPVENIKITTPADFYIFRAITEAKENSQIWGI